jgi:hypothetical protein
MDVSDDTRLMASELLKMSYTEVSDIPEDFPPLCDWLHQLVGGRYEGGAVLAWLQALVSASELMAPLYQTQVLDQPDYDQHIDYPTEVLNIGHSIPGLVDLLDRPDDEQALYYFKQLITFQYTYGDISIAQMDYEMDALHMFLHYLKRTDIPKE